MKLLCGIAFLGGISCISVEARAQCINLAAGPVVASADSLCEGASVELTITTFSPGSATLQWQFLDGIIWSDIPGETSPSAVQSPLETSSFRCIVVCDTDSVFSDTINVHVTPAFDLVVNSTDTVFCDQASATMVAENATEYAWSPDTGLNVDTGGTVVCDATETSTYSVVGTTGPCSDTASITITILPFPDEPEITLLGPDTFCFGDSVQLTSAALGDLLWSTGDTTDTITVDQGSEAWLTVSVAECSATSDTISLTESAPVVASCPADTLVCANSQPFDPIDLVTDGGEFSIDGAPIDDFDPSLHPVGDIEVLHTVTVDGCSGSCTFIITTEEPPNAGEDGALSVCANGSPVSLFDALPGDPGTGGAWSSPDGNPHASTYDPQAEDPGGFIYSVQGVNACPADSASVTVQEQEAPAPPVLLSVDGPIVCHGQWTDLGVLPPLVGTYSWVVDPAHATLFNNGPEPTVQWMNNTGSPVAVQISVVNDVNGCTSSALFDFTISPSPASCPRGIVFFEPHGLAILDMPAHHFQWGTIDGGTFLPLEGATGQSYFHPQIDSCYSGFAVRTSINGECWTTTARCADAFTLNRSCAPSGGGMAAGPELRVHPNPWIEGSLTIAPFHGEEEAVPLEVIDLQGRVLFVTLLPSAGASLGGEWIERSMRGVLLVRASFKAGPQTIKLVVP